MKSVNDVWLEALAKTITYGKKICARNMETLELTNVLLKIDMKQPVISVAERNLNYKFMAAEAYWILSGSNRVADIVPWCKNISAYSDDGKTFFGAYGPRIAAQKDRLVATLAKDLGSRQATMNIWRENPPSTKDVPCTLSIGALVRNNALDVNVCMRSSDLWLGLPYDIFNFSMVGYSIRNSLALSGIHVDVGILNLYAVSSHLYEKNKKDAELVLWRDKDDAPNSFETNLWKILSNDELLVALDSIRNSPKIGGLYALFNRYVGNEPCIRD